MFVRSATAVGQFRPPSFVAGGVWPLIPFARRSMVHDQRRLYRRARDDGSAGGTAANPDLVTAFRIIACVIAADGGADRRSAGIDNITATAADDGEAGQAPGLDVLAAAGLDRTDRRAVENIGGLHPAQNLVDQVFAVYVVKNLMK
jgi:hypothetical protein